MTKKFNLYNIMFIFITGSILHFVYEWSGNNFGIGLICPANESVFSHTKLLILPTILFYLIFFKKKKELIDKDRYFSAMLIQLVSSILSMVFIYYTARFGFNIINLYFDIVLFLFSIVIGVILSNHYYKYSNKSFNYYLLGLIIIIFVIAMSIYPLDYPFFIS